MKICLGLMWLQSKRNLATGFKHSGAFELFNTYLTRLGAYAEVEVQRPDLKSLKDRDSSEKLWICERAQLGAKTISSEDLALKLEKLQLNGAKRLWILIGEADGFDKEVLEELRPDLLWSFGPATYPHELASVMMTEQVYRAFSILHKHPYHGGH
jgi:23S rRNA (pseudouridine1915-N3)-methyltransferase